MGTPSAPSLFFNQRQIFFIAFACFVLLTQNAISPDD
jgi:hypothetical protein